MIKKLLNIFLFFLLCSTPLIAQSFGNRISVPILEIKEKFIFTPALDIKKGESGLIVHKFNEHSLIIAKASVVEVQQDKAKMLIKNYTTLNHPSFPHAKMLPQIGDHVILRSFYHRAFLIAPNQESYINALEKYHEVEWLHPDLFAAYLINQGKSVPTIADFQSVCDVYSAGVLYIVGSKYAEARDCQSFGIIAKDPISPSKHDDQILPFFSRFGNIKRTWLNALMGEPKVGDYYLYYADLINGFVHESHMGAFNRVFNTMIGAENP